MHRLWSRFLWEGTLWLPMHFVVAGDDSPCSLCGHQQCRFVSQAPALKTTAEAVVSENVSTPRTGLHHTTAHHSPWGHSQASVHLYRLLVKGMAPDIWGMTYADDSGCPSRAMRAPHLSLRERGAPSRLLHNFIYHRRCRCEGCQHQQLPSPVPGGQPHGGCGGGGQARRQTQGEAQRSRPASDAHVD